MSTNVVRNELITKKLWQKYVTNKIMKNGCEKWKNGLKKEAERQYLEYKRQPAVEEYASYVDGRQCRNILIT